MKTLSLVLACFLSLFSFSQDEKVQYVVFDDTMRFEVKSKTYMDSVDYMSFRGVKKVKVIEVNKEEEETVLPVVGGNIMVLGVSATNEIDSSGTIVVPEYRTQSILFLSKEQQFRIIVKYEIEDGSIQTAGLLFYGKP